MTNGDAWQAVNENFGDLFRRVNELEARATPSPTAEVISLFMSLPGLRGFWPMSSIDYAAANRAIDVSGQDNHLTANNVPLFGYDGLAPYVKFDGVDQYLSRADGGAANWADIIGTEAYILSGQRGLTMGGWFKLATPSGSIATLINKWDKAAQKSYTLRRNAAGVLKFIITSDVGGVNSNEVILSLGPIVDVWSFVAARFIPSNEIKIWHNTNSAVKTNLIEATISDGTADFAIGAASNVVDFADGNFSMCFLCAAALSDDIISQLYQQSRGLFRV